MVSALADILGALREEISGAVITAQWPSRKLDSPVIVVQEINNMATEIPVVDALSYQVDVWAEEGDTVRALFGAADAYLSGRGWLRSFCPALTRDGFGCRQTARYSRRVDKRTLRLID